METVAHCDMTYNNLKLRRFRLKDFKGWITGAITNADGKSIDLLQLITLKVRVKEFKKSISDFLFGEENIFDFRIGLFQADLEMLKTKGIYEKAAKDGGIYDVDLDDEDDGEEEEERGGKGKEEGVARSGRVEKYGKDNEISDDESGDD